MASIGIQWISHKTPLKVHLQALAAGSWFFILALSGFLCLLFSIYLVFCTKLWLVTLLYLLWIWGPDRKTCERGGRRLKWVQSLSWWQYFKDYFPTRLECVPSAKLDPKKNYLFCCYPHGMIPVGPFSAFGTSVGGFNKMFPNHRPYNLTLNLHFNMPFFREFVFALGGVSASSKSIKWVLSNRNGGNVGVLLVGGASESFYCRPGDYEILLKNRKGFVKLALKTGAPLVPVFSFGEINTFNQIDNPKGSLLRTAQDWFKDLTGFAPALPLGRGLLQYSFGLIPKNTPIVTVSKYQS